METLPSSTRKPGSYIGFDTRRAQNSLPANRMRVLILAQRLAAGSIAALLPTAVFSDKDAAKYFGPGSPAYLMAAIAVKNNSLLDLTVLAVDEAPGSAAAQGRFLITGPATGPGLFRAFVGNNKIEFAVATGDTETELAAQLDAAILALDNVLPATSTAALGAVTVDSKIKGEFGNGIRLAAECTAPGVAVAVTEMSGGLVDPDISDALAVVYGTRYHIIVSQFTDSDNLTRLRDHVEEVSDKIEQRGTRAYYGSNAPLGTAVSIPPGLNSGRTRLPYLRGSYSHECEIAAAFAGYRASIEDPSMPLDGDVIKGLHVPSFADRLSRAEQESCLHNGVTPLEVSPGDKIQIVRAVTNYLVDQDGVADEALLDESAIDTLDYLRDVIRSIPKPKKITAKTLVRLRDLYYAALKRLETAEILVDIDLHKDRLIVEKAEGRVGWVHAVIPSPVVPGLHILDGTIELYV